MHRTCFLYSKYQVICKSRRKKLDELCPSHESKHVLRHAKNDKWHTKPRIVCHTFAQRNKSKCSKNITSREIQSSKCIMSVLGFGRPAFSTRHRFLISRVDYVICKVTAVFEFQCQNCYFQNRAVQFFPRYLRI